MCKKSACSRDQGYFTDQTGIKNVLVLKIPPDNVTKLIFWTLVSLINPNNWLKFQVKRITVTVKMTYIW